MTAPSKDSLTRGTALGLLSEAMILPTGIVSAAILTRTLGLDLYGLIGVTMAAVSPIAWFLTSIFGMRSSVKIVADASDPLAAASALLRMNLFIGALGGATFFLSAPLIATWLGQPSIVTALRIGALEILLMPLARAHRDALLGTMRYGSAGLAGGVFHVARLAVVIVLLVAGVGIETVVWAHVIGRLAEIWWCRRSLAIPLGLHFRLASKAIARLVAPSFLNAMCLRIIDALDILVLSALGAASTVLGHYSAALMLAQLPRMLNVVVAPGLIVALSKATAARDIGLLTAIREDASRLIASVAALLLVAAGAAPTILLILFGVDFVGGATILSLLLIGGIGIVVFSICSSEYVAVNKAWIPVTVSFPALCVHVALLYLLVPRFGALGAATSTAVTFTAAGITLLVLSRQQIGIRIRHLAVGLVAGALGGGIAALLAAQGVIIVDGITGALIAAGVLFAGGVLDRGIVTRFLGGFGAIG